MQPQLPSTSPETPLRPKNQKSSVRLAVAILVAAILIVTAAIRCCRNTVPLLPFPIVLQVEFPAGKPNTIEPLIVSGAFCDGDFLTVRYLEAGMGTIGYDSWGAGGPESPAIPLLPGKRRTLEIEMPSLWAQNHQTETPKVRIKLDGRELVHTPVSFHECQTDEIYFGLNPIGGTPAASFRGTLFAADGKPLLGPAKFAFTRAQRFSHVIRHRLPHLVAASLSAAVAGWLLYLVLGLRRCLVAEFCRHHRAFFVVGVLCLAVFGTVLTGGTFNFRFPDHFGVFFDFQAASILDGRLDVPDKAISGEAFVVRGKRYGYFGITPSLLRIPFVATGVGFGRLTRPFMTAYFAACLAAAYAFLRHFSREVLPHGRDPSPWAVAIFVPCAGLGSTLLFLGARSYIYHEAILCGAAFGLWSAYFSVRYLNATEPSRWWLAAAATGALAVHARPPAGLFALFFLGCIAAFKIVRELRSGHRSQMRTHAAAATAALFAMLSFNGMSYLKFQTFDGSPLRYSVQYTAERLARFGGRNFHRSNLRHNIDTYVLVPDVKLRPNFPFLFFGDGGGRAYPEAKIDLGEPTLAIPVAMPGLSVLAVLAILAAARRRSLRPTFGLLLAGALPMALALFTAVVTSHRYTGDFCPFLIILAALSVAAFDAEQQWRRTILMSFATVAALSSITASTLVAIEFQGEIVWGVPPEMHQNFLLVRDRIDGWTGHRHPGN